MTAIAVAPATCVTGEVSKATWHAVSALATQVGPHVRSMITVTVTAGRDECRERFALIQGKAVGGTTPLITHESDQANAFFDEHPDDCVLIVAACAVDDAYAAHARGAS